MILIEDTKYSCMECIRGHRSSLCRHHTRPLLQVRSKGRPNVHANGNANHRIAVFAKEIVPLTSNKKDPIVVLKASEKQIIDIENGKLLGPYIAYDNVRPPPPPIINSNSFVITLGCGCDINKVQKSCGCSNKKRSVNKSKILKTYLSKRLKQEKVGKPDIKLENIESLVKISDCAEGSCVCDGNCNCPGCKVHNVPDNDNGIVNMSIPNGIPNIPMNVPQVPIQNMMNAPYDMQKSPQYNYLNTPYLETDSPCTCSCPDNNCECTNCETHGIINGLKLDELFSMNYDPNLLATLPDVDMKHPGSNKLIPGLTQLNLLPDNINNTNTANNNINPLQHQFNNNLSSNGSSNNVPTQSSCCAKNDNTPDSVSSDESVKLGSSKSSESSSVTSKDDLLAKTKCCTTSEEFIKCMEAAFERS